MVISPPGAMGTPPKSLAACTTPCASLSACGRRAVLTTAVNVVDLPPDQIPVLYANAFTNMVTVPGLNGLHVPCQIPFPMCVICTESLLEKLAFTLRSAPGPDQVAAQIRYLHIHRCRLPHHCAERRLRRLRRPKHYQEALLSTRMPPVGLPGCLVRHALIETVRRRPRTAPRPSAR